MESLHDLLNMSSRAVNRHAQRIYGFIPAIVISDFDKDTKQKRHLRGMVQVYFPGLQDLGPELIAPWARLVVPSGGNMIDVNKKKTVTITILVPGPLQPKQVTVTEIVPGKTHTETRTRKIKKHTHIHKEWEVFSIDNANFRVDSAFIAPAGLAQLQQAATKFKSAPPGTKLLVHGHASPNFNGTAQQRHAYNLGLSNRRAQSAKNALVRMGVDAGAIESEGFSFDHSGERYNAEKRTWEPNPRDDPTHKEPAFRNSNQECGPGGCRRVDVMFDYHGVSDEDKDEEIEEKYQVTVQDPPKIVTKTKTVMVPGPPTERKIQIQVPDPGPGPNGGGLFIPPQKGDEVLCGFEHGDIHRPYVIGALWNGKDKIPEPVTNAKTEDSRPKGCPETKSFKSDSLSGDGGKNTVQYIRSRTGNVIALNDTSGQEGIRTSDRSGTSCMQQGKDKIEIMQSSKDISIFAAKKVRFDCTDFLVKTKKSAWLDATGSIKSKSGKDHSISADSKVQISSTGAAQLISQADIGFDAQQRVAFTAKGKNVAMTTGGKFNFGGAKPAEIEAQGGSVTFLGAAKVAVEGKNGVGIKSDGDIDITAGIKLKFKGSNVLMNSGGSPPGQINFGSLLMGALKSVVGTVVQGAVAAGQAIASSPIAAAAVGAAVGFCVMGPLGMVAGAAIGYKAAGGQLPGAPTPPNPLAGVTGGKANVGNPDARFGYDGSHSGGLSKEDIALSDKLKKNPFAPIPLGPDGKYPMGPLSDSLSQADVNLKKLDDPTTPLHYEDSRCGAESTALRMMKDGPDKFDDRLKSMQDAAQNAQPQTPEKKALAEQCEQTRNAVKNGTLSSYDLAVLSDKMYAGYQPDKGADGKPKHGGLKGPQVQQMLNDGGLSTTLQPPPQVGDIPPPPPPEPMSIFQKKSAKEATDDLLNNIPAGGDKTVHVSEFADGTGNHFITVGKDEKGIPYVEDTGGANPPGPNRFYGDDAKRHLQAVAITKEGTPPQKINPTFHTVN